MPWATVFQNVYLPLKLAGVSKAETRDKIMAALNTVGLADFAESYPRQLSGGMKMRVSIARALITKPSLLLMDEPFAGVDAKTDNMLIEILHQLRDEGNTIVLVHHDLTTVKDYFDHVVLLNRKLVACGTTPQTFTAENIELAYGVAGKQLLSRIS